jgi:hypothetical protein
MNIVDNYLEGLKKEIAQYGSEDDLNDLKIAEGASKEDIDKLKSAYPECPSSLINLLKCVNGTFHRMQGEHLICVYILGSDLGSYPYYLLSVDQILESINKDRDFSYLMEYYPDKDVLDSKIHPVLKAGKYLHFSNCMNNGGTSELFIDFNPTEKGVCGQIVRYVHDPDECRVIADSFGDYLQFLMDKKYEFVQ